MHFTVCLKRDIIYYIISLTIFLANPHTILESKSLECFSFLNLLYCFMQSTIYNPPSTTQSTQHSMNTKLQDDVSGERRRSREKGELVYCIKLEGLLT